MLNIKKTVTLAAIVLFSFNSYAQDKSSTRSEDAMKIISSIKKDFKLKTLSSENKKQLGDVFSYFIEDEWYSWVIGNEDSSVSKFKKDKFRIYDLIIANKSRITNITFTYFPQANQIFWIRKQYVSDSSDKVLKAFKVYKKEKDTKVLKETSNYGFTMKKGYIDIDIFHVAGKEGLIAYIDAGIINVK